MRLVIFSLAAGAAMWILGFVFYGLLSHLGWSAAPEATQLALHEALKALPGNGTYVVPAPDTPALVAAYQAGPIAQITYHAAGGPVADPLVFVGGFFQFTLVAALIGWLIAGLGNRIDIIGRIRVVLGLAAIAVVFLDLSDAIWMRGDWQHAIYTAVADFIILGTGGLIMARWYVNRRSNTLR